MFLSGSNFKNIFRMLLFNRFNLSWKYIPKLLLNVFLITILTPFRIMEAIYVKRKIKGLELKEDPIFILGHWRTGTTHLHKLLYQDDKFIYQTFPESMHPRIFLLFSRLLKLLFSIFMPKTRPYDAMRMDTTFPGETDTSIMNISSYTQNMCFFFPENRLHYRKYAELEDIPQKHREKWKKDLVLLFKKLQLKNPDKQLLIKNPPDTARVQILLETFPNAKFIYIYRNPYEVYSSSQRMFRYFFHQFVLQKPKYDLDEFLLENYQILESCYHEKKGLIQKNNLVEVRYEDLVKNPLGELERVYSTLAIPDFEEVKQKFEDYLSSVENYKVHKYNFSKEEKVKIYSKMNFLIDKNGYEKPY
jgi:hypothetical protein